jgi:hypothetical protein
MTDPLIQDVEKKIETAVPGARPEVEAVGAAADAELQAAAAKGAAAGAAAAQHDPGAAAVARDAASIASGHAVAPIQLVSDVSHLTHEVKSGYKTTEFWLSTAVIVLSQLGVFSLPGHYGKTITTAAAAAAYAISRGLAK